MDCDKNCFLCLKKLTPLKAEIKDSESKTLKQTLHKIFQYLLVPDKDFNEVYSSLKSQPSFCSDCSIIVQEIAGIGKKVTALELFVQHKVETLGLVIAASASKLVSLSLEKGKIRTEEDKLLWEKLRNPVLQNYMKGTLPTPSIVLSKYPPSMKDVSKIEEAPFNSDSKSKRIKKSCQLPPPAPSILNPKRKRKDSSSCDEEEDDTDSSIDDEKDYLECPSCPFKSTIEVIEKNNKQARKSAISIMISHFTTHHNPVKRKNISEGTKGNKFYKCTSCEFRSIVQTHKRSARLELSRHYLTTHYKFKEVICSLSKEDITVKPTGKVIAKKSKLSKESEENPAKKAKSSKEKISDLVEGEDYFACPKEDCSFIATLTNIKSKQKLMSKKRTALFVIAKHHIYAHLKIDMDDHFINFNSNCLIQTKEGQMGFKCPNKTPSCDFIQLFDYPKDKDPQKFRKNQFNIFLRHYLTHIGVKQKVREFLGILKCAEGGCRFNVENRSYPFKYPSERGKKMKEKMTQHYQMEHPDKPIPIFKIYRPKKPIL